ncbi:hypothetical protein BG003_001690 [Podila horticola]|nr:hypothetical protein BG003_001690 [Podila horticola]
MKFTSIAFASVAYLAASASAFNWSCEQEHFYGQSGIRPDIMGAESQWNKENGVKNTVSYTGSFLKITCQPLKSPVQQSLCDCRNALDWLWNTVNADNSQWLDRQGLLPRKCWVNNDALIVTWNNK